MARARAEAAGCSGKGRAGPRQLAFHASPDGRGHLPFTLPATRSLFPSRMGRGGAGSDDEFVGEEEEGLQDSEVR